MNKNIFILLLVFPLLVSVTSCQEELFFSTDVTVIETDYPGGDYVLTINSNASWKLSDSYPANTEKYWLHADCYQGEKGTMQISIHIDPSEGRTREGNLVFELVENEQYYHVSVLQQGKLDRDMSDLLSKEFFEHILSRYHNQRFLLYSDLLSIHKLDISGKSFDFMDDLAYLDNLEELDCSDCGLEAFTTSMPNLKKLVCNGNRLSGFDPELFPNLQELVCRENNITEFYPESFPSLITLDCSQNPLQTIDVQSTTRLSTLYCYLTPLKELVVGPSIEILLFGPDIENPDLSKAVNISILDCSDSAGLKELDLSNCANLFSLYCQRSPNLHTLVLPETQKLSTVDCASCQLTGELDISSKDIEWVNCSDNKLSGLRFAEDAALGSLYCSDNLLEELILPRPSKVRYLKCNGNLLSELGILTTYLEWTTLLLKDNPGKDGVFTVYVDESVKDTSPEYIPAMWNWNGMDVHTKVVRCSSN